jgi:hypothetical protein
MARLKELLQGLQAFSREKTTLFSEAWKKPATLKSQHIEQGKQR